MIRAARGRTMGMVAVTVLLCAPAAASAGGDVVWQVDTHG